MLTFAMVNVTNLDMVRPAPTKCLYYLVSVIQEMQNVKFYIVHNDYVT